MFQSKSYACSTGSQFQSNSQSMNNLPCIYAKRLLIDLLLMNYDNVFLMVLI